MDKEEFKQMLIDVIREDVRRWRHSEIAEVIYDAYQCAQREHDRIEASCWT